MTARILLVDDNVALTENLRDILEGAPELEAEVHRARDAQAALEIARDQGFDVALVDVKLPDGNGLRLVQALRCVSPFSEVIMVTGFATVDAAIGALQAGAFAFLLKSFRPEEVIATVEQAFAKVQLKREREELQQQQRALIETAGVLIVALDGEDRIALFNPKVEELTAGGVPVFVGGHFEGWVSEEHHERMRSALRKARLSKDTVEVEASFTDGQQEVPHRRIQWHLSTVQSGGQRHYVYGIGVDVTERRALEKRAAAAEALSAMGTLALGLAHEIRNPLNAAVLQLHLLGKAIDKLSVEHKKQMLGRVAIVDAEIGRLERLLTEFLELARPRGLQLAEVDLGQLVESVLSLEGDALVLRNVDVHCDLPPNVKARGDSEKLRQVLINLIVNARDALRNGGRLSLRVWAEPRPVIEVADNGPGIDSQVIESIFDPFFTTKEAGTGLGLAIVRKIVDQHGGQITIDSSPGEGTRVQIHLCKWEGQKVSFPPLIPRGEGGW
jgi:PAS domain S-box-containing protein